MTLKIAIPNKGRLAEETVDALRAIGLRVPRSSDRSLIASVNGGKYQVLFTRAQDIPEFVEFGAADLGITGLDLVRETGASVEKVLDFSFGACRLVLAGPDNGHIRTVDDIPAGAKVATTFPNLTRAFFAKSKKKVRIVPSAAALKQRASEIDDLVHAFQSVQEASRRRYLMANVDRKKLPEITKILPGLSGPTVMELAVKGKVAVHAVVHEDDINTVVPKLKRAGATGILVLPIERLIP
jgi:ATP phosphoribosyltransferase